MTSILMVCSGNVCRSPMAVGLMRRALESRQLDRPVRVFSAGVWALDGQPASENAVATMAERGIDISDHIAHTITAADVGEADLILVMGGEHKQMICNTWPQYEFKTFRLAEMSGKRKDIRDPYQRPMEAYRECADTIGQTIERGLERILELS